VAELAGRVRRRVRTSDAEYRWRYEREVRQYVARHDPARCWEEEGPGALLLTTGRWAWVHGDDAAAARWRRYAKQHRGLKVMNPDGTWRVWEPGEES
jgi:hypothetical protein